MTDSPPAAPATTATSSASSGDRTKWILFAVVGTLSLVADQITKIWARGLPTEPAGCDVPDAIVQGRCIGSPVSVIESFWHWRLSMNPGSAFGLFSTQGTLGRVGLSVVGIVAVFGMLWMLRKARPEQKILHWALALVAGGAVGNLIDRIYYGVVTDFILWHVGDPTRSVPRHAMRWEHEWPVFNVADIVLVAGVILMFIDIQKEGKREKALKAGKQSRAKAAGLVRH